MASMLESTLGLPVIRTTECSGGGGHDRLQDIDSRNGGHVDVNEHDVIPGPTDHLDSFVAAGRNVHSRTLRYVERWRSLPEGSIIVDDQGSHFFGDGL